MEQATRVVDREEALQELRGVKLEYEFAIKADELATIAAVAQAIADVNANPPLLYSTTH